MNKECEGGEGYTMKKVLIWYDKHRDLIWDITYPELRKRAFLKIHTEKKESGYYSDLDSVNKSRCESEMRDRLEKLSKAPLGSEEMRILLASLQTLNEELSDGGDGPSKKHMLELYRKAEAGDSDAAEKLAHVRRDGDYEYEGFCIKEVE